ncbi:MAG TPA: maltose ABC transporter permease MalF [Kofleriaceae bacterium]|nr:maltose ABC transporter permease MalF [Kofleriaceae bacterium]
MAAVVAVVCLYLVYGIYASGNPMLAAVVGGFMGLGFFIYTARRGYTLRYLFPGLAGIGLFVLLPLLYTTWIGFTNYGSKNLLTFTRATEVLLEETYQKEGAAFSFALHPDGEGFRIVLTAEEEAPPPPEEAGAGGGAGGGGSGDGGGGLVIPGAPGTGGGDLVIPGAPGDISGAAGDGAGSAGSAGSAGAAGSAGSGAGAGSGAPVAQPQAPKPSAVFVTPVLRLTDKEKRRIEAVPLAGSGFVPGEPAPIKDVVDRRDAIAALTIVFPDRSTATMAGLREFGRNEPLYKRNADGTLTNQQTGVAIAPSFETGFYETPDHQPVLPGFRTNVGGANFERIFTDEKFRGPLFQIFAWTIVFSGLTVLFTVVIGVLLAELLSWEGLRFGGVYRILLFLPYAVPGFISILVFKGLFNRNFGEINMILDGLFGIRPNWTGDATLAKAMILIVNTWLGYPYFMLLCMGLQKSIPRDLYEASALAGAGPLTNFWKITWPLIRRPLTPLMVSAFAFNFNNFVLIYLLTDGRPDFLNTMVPAGETDLLVTYTYRIAFQDSGKNFGLAAAIATIMFVIVAILSVINLRLTKATAVEKR